MSNRTIAIIFMCISWMMFVMSIVLAIPLFIFYSVLAIFLSHIIYHKQNNDSGGPRMRL